MQATTDYISVSSKGNRDMIDITPGIRNAIAKAGVRSGIVTVFVPGSTAAITTLEFEPGLTKDLDEFLEKLIPYNYDYSHHQTWHDDNGSSHLQAAMLGPSVTIPVVNGALTLGTWQQVVLIDCDTRPRSRKIVVQMLY
ncbi:MAG: secondary thiamine-phosphate synthase enzyme YjbQ [Spirochaetes bacterium]|jgi:secondary thiamine-phosphate synthase enzyme|nr:secondary thiamine-phosphate synthase enzyme YjbQ [Spirochaetota bacterium]